MPALVRSKTHQYFMKSVANQTSELMVNGVAWFSTTMNHTSQLSLFRTLGLTKSL